MGATDRELLPALAHELGNLLAAVRLAAHLLPAETSADERARQGRQIEELAAEAGELAALLRPFTGARRGRVVEVDVARALAAARSAVGEEAGAPRVVLRPAPSSLPRAHVDPDALHHAVAALLRAALAASGPGGAVGLGARRSGGSVLIEISDGTPASAAGASLRGRALRARLADAVLRRSGGGVELAASRSGTRVRVRLPVAEPPGAPAPRRAPERSARAAARPRATARPARGRGASPRQGSRRPRPGPRG